MSTADDEDRYVYDPETASDRERAAYEAGQRRALEDAADYAEAVDEDGDRPGLEATGVWDSAPDELTELLMRPDGLELLTRWLRDRAAGVGIDSRTPACLTVSRRPTHLPRTETTMSDATVWDEGYKRGAADWAAVNLKALEVAIAPNPYRTTGENPMSDGLHQKYNVQRINDTDGKHDGCRYFVLDPQHDPLALEALHWYSRIAREAGYLALAADLLAWVRQVEDDQR